MDARIKSAHDGLRKSLRQRARARGYVWSNPSCPALCRASTSWNTASSKTWMAGTSPAMTIVLLRSSRRKPGPVFPAATF